MASGWPTAGPYLVGERFSAADLTFAALAARRRSCRRSTACRCPSPTSCPAPMAARVRALREHPAGAFALRMFAEERR